MVPSDCGQLNSLLNDGSTSTKVITLLLILFTEQPLIELGFVTGTFYPDSGDTRELFGCLLLVCHLWSWAELWSGLDLNGAFYSWVLLYSWVSNLLGSELACSARPIGIQYTFSGQLPLGHHCWRVAYKPNICEANIKFTSSRETYV